MTRKDINTDEIVQLYLQGKIPADIAKQYGCTGSLIRSRLTKAGVYVKKKTPKRAEHGTRTMYVHHGCRCEACCRAEHEYYLKRPESKKRIRKHSKHGNVPYRTKNKYYAERRDRLNNRERSLNRPSHWRDIAETFDMKCAICGGEVDETDKWINESGCYCFGRNYPTVDHILSLKAGGTDTFDNVQLAHKHCNCKKGARVIEHAKEQAITNKCA